MCNGVNQVLLPRFEPLKDVMKLGAVAHEVAVSLLEFFQGCLKKVLR